MRGEWDVSIRRACRVFEVDTSTYHYKSRRPGQAALEARIREICQTRVRYGYRRVHIQLWREGWSHGQNKTRRIYRELGLGKKEFSDDEIISLMAEHPDLIQRPIVERGDRAVLGRPTENVKVLL